MGWGRGGGWLVSGRDMKVWWVRGLPEISH